MSSISSIFCLAPSRGGADRILHELTEAQFTAPIMGALLLEQNGADLRDRDRGGLTDAAARSAGAIRGGLASLTGIARVMVPGVGWFIAAGPIIGALHRVRHGAPGVAIARGLVLLGLAAADATRYEQRIKADGHILLSVHGSDHNRILRARAALAAAHALDICIVTETAVPRGEGAARPSRTAHFDLASAPSQQVP